MTHGGKRPGAGRPKGAKAVKATSNKKTRAQTGEIVERALKNNDVMPLEAMLRNLRVLVTECERLLEAGVPVVDREHLALRKLATKTASAVAPFVHPKLSAIAVAAAPADEAARERDALAIDEFKARIERLAENHKRMGTSEGDDGRVEVIEPIRPPVSSRAEIVKRTPPRIDAMPSDQPRSKMQPGDVWKDAYR